MSLLQEFSNSDMSRLLHVRACSPCWSSWVVFGSLLCILDISCPLLLCLPRSHTQRVIISTESSNSETWIASSFSHLLHVSSHTPHDTHAVTSLRMHWYRAVFASMLHVEDSIRLALAHIYVIGTRGLVNLMILRYQRVLIPTISFIRRGEGHLPPPVSSDCH